MSARRDNAAALAGAAAPGTETRADTEDCATASAARLGLTLQRLGRGAWLLLHAGVGIAAGRGLDALGAALADFSTAQHVVRELLQRMRGAA